MLNILIGKANTGKSKYIYDKIDENIEKNNDVILFVPSQMRALSEIEYINYQKKQGIIDFKITTISEYISDYLNNTNINFNQKYITNLDKKLILSRILSQNDNILNVFKKVKQKQGFLDLLNIYIDLFKKQNIDANKLKEIKTDNLLLKQKLNEISDVYLDYCEILKDRFVDSVDEITIFCKDLPDRFGKKAKTEVNTNIFFDGYNNFNENEYLFIETLLKCRFNLTFSIDSDIEIENADDINSLSNLTYESSIFSVSNITILKLISLCKKNNFKFNIIRDEFSSNKLNLAQDIKYLANNIFSSDVLKIKKEKIKAENIEMLLTSNIYTETQNVVQSIVKNIKLGYRYSDFLIYVSSIDEYEDIFKQIFYKYNIPFYINSTVFLKDSLLVKYILKLLDIAIYGFKTDNLFEILKFGLNDIELDDIYYIENYVLEFNISKYSWNKEFTLNNDKSDQVTYDLAKINNTREKILNLFNDFINIDKLKFNSKEIIQKIYLHLKVNNILERYKNIIGFMQDSNDNELTYLSQINMQVWDKLCEVFNSIDKIYSDKKSDVTEFRDMFDFVVKDIKLKSIPATKDQVLVLDINSDKSSPKYFVYILGVNENKLPKKIDQDAFFSDNDLENIESITQQKIREDSISKLNMQLYNIYVAINNVKKHLYMLIQSSDILGASLRPSSLIEDIKQLINIDMLGEVTQKNDIEKYDINSFLSISNIFEYMLKKLYSLEENQDNLNELNNEKLEILAIYKYIKTNKKYLEILNYIKNDDNLNKKTLDKLYNKDLTTSVSRLELFKKCPFSYYMNYSLKIKPRKVFSISSIDIGIFMHSVLEEFSKYIYQDNITWPAILNDNSIYELWNKKLDEIINEQLKNSFLNHGESIKYVVLKKKLENTMKKVILTIAKSFNQSEFVPFGYEIEFKKNSEFLPIDLNLENGKHIYLIGKIDRIDVLKFNEKLYARIIDYKSSSRNLSLDDIKEGLSLQLITYLYAFVQNIEDKEKVSVIPAAMLYFNLSDNLVSLNIDEKDQINIERKIAESLRMKGIFLKNIEIINKMDKEVGNANRLIDISTRTINSNTSNKALLEQEYVELFKEAEKILKAIGSEILNGVVRIEPNRKKDVCKFCNFSSVCRKDICL